MHADTMDQIFTGSIPEIYQRFMVPIFFEPYAENLAVHVAKHQPMRVLEIAAGTGVVTRQLAITLPDNVTIVTTDLNQPMLDHAAALGTSRAVQWQVADAMQLPFADASFDLIVCQFGVMFFPDKAQAFAESRRVLKTGGAFIFNVWDKLDQNEFADTVTQSVEASFPDDPPRFFERVPHGYFDVAVIAQDLSRGGFTRAPDLTTVTRTSRAASARIPAIALCQGTPLRNEIVARDSSLLDQVTDQAALAIEHRFGQGGIEGKMQAHVVTAVK